MIDAVSDSMMMTDDSGQSFRTILPPIGAQLSAFLLAGDGTLYAGTRTGKLYVLPPGAQEFTERAAPHLRCLGQRPGSTRIYACTNLVTDGYSLASSDDLGQTFQRVMSFRISSGPSAVLRSRRTAPHTGSASRESSESVTPAPMQDRVAPARLHRMPACLRRRRVAADAPAQEGRCCPSWRCSL